MYVYIKSEPQLWTVGHYDPSGKWEPESDHGTRDAATERTAWLNGSGRGLEDEPDKEQNHAPCR